MDMTVQPGRRRGRVSAPPSKSHAHRLLLCAALSEGESCVELGALSDDICATLSCLSALGAAPMLEGGSARFPAPLSPPVGRAILPCGESGSTLRFLLPLCGALGVEAEFVMAGRLPQRPLAPLDALLRRQGMALWRGGNTLYCRGALRSGEYSIDAGVSSQYITGLLYALPLLAGESSLSLTGKIESAPYIAMTEDALRQSGIRFRKEGRRYTIHGGQHYALGDNGRVEGDCSQAAFFLALGAFSDGGVTVENYPTASLQGDREMLTLLRAFGAEVEVGEESVFVRRGKLRGIEIDASQIPDLVPVLGVVGAAAEGTTLIKNAARLRLKESDRLASTAALLRALGGEVDELPDALRIHGGKSLRGGSVESFHDHRIAMAAAVAASLCKESILVSDAFCTDKSFPAFWEVFSSLECEP